MRLLGDDLEDRLGQAVAVDQGEHRLLHRVEGRILPGPRPAAVMTALVICTSAAPFLVSLRELPWPGPSHLQESDSVSSPLRRRQPRSSGPDNATQQ